MAVLRHGLFEAADHKKLAQAILEEKATNAGSEDSGDSNPTDAMRVQALKARQDLKKALKLQRRLETGEGHEFTPAEVTLVQRLETGQLEQDRKQANQNYGHGAGVEKR